MIITKYVLVKWNPKNKKWFENNGYVYTKIDDEFYVKIEDLNKGSHALIEVKCDCVNCENTNTKFIIWRDYNKCILNSGKYYCKKCISKERIENGRLTKLKNGKSFEQWCLENNQQNTLNRWDYELNNCKPNKITYGTHKNYYFKCPRGLHESELKNIHSFTGGQEGSMDCKQCNSFAQFGIDNIDKNFLDKYWDYSKNTINPWDIAKGCEEKVWLICQENKDHDSYFSLCKSFSGKNSRCPICNESKGEKIISEYLCLNNFIKIIQIEYKKLIKRYNKNYFIPQKEFNGLIGLGNGLLSYDFYIPKLNLLIEYQGEQHERYIPGFHKTYDDFLKQLEHDRRKREYTKLHNINLLEIWYYDFDKIDEILEKELNY